MVNPRASGLKLATFPQGPDLAGLASCKTLARKETALLDADFTLYRLLRSVANT